MDFAKRDCPIKMQLIPYGSGWTNVFVDFGDGELYFIISDVMGYSFTALIQSLYLLHPDNAVMEENWGLIDYKEGVIEEGIVSRVIDFGEEKESFHTYKLIPWKASFEWDEEGSVSDWVIERPANEEKSFPIKVTIDIHRSEIKHYEYTVDYADMCYAVADACTKALKKHGFNGYHNSTYTEDMNIRHLLFLKSVALRNMEACKLTYYAEKGKGETSDFCKEIELLLFDM